MSKQRRKLKTLISLVSAIVITASLNINTRASSDPNRMSGLNRYDTSIEVSKNGWTSSSVAVLVTQDGFADALSSTPLAKKFNAPILLTPKNSLIDPNANSNLKDELKRLGVTTVYIIGGTSIISENVEKELKTLNINSIRIFGQDRYETSVKIAEMLGGSSEVAIANGYSYADGLSIAPVAAKKGFPILLTEPSKLPDSVKNYLKNKNFTKSYIVGGTGVINPTVETSLSNPERFAGYDRYDTNAQVIKKFSSIFNSDSIYVATGENYPDALSGSALAAKNSRPLVLVSPSLSPYTSKLINDQFPLINKESINIFGGESIVSSEVVDTLSSINKFEVISID